MLGGLRLPRLPGASASTEAVFFKHEGYFGAIGAFLEQLAKAQKIVKDKCFAQNVEGVKRSKRNLAEELATAAAHRRRATAGSESISVGEAVSNVGGGMEATAAR